ncbi:MAG: leucine-rich repeat domain-containing protein, partial [Bacteroidota bacterium]
NNLLTEVQPTSPFLQLESLHLVNNLLTDFRPDPSLFPQLTFLDLRHNPLRVDKEILYKHWPQLTHLLV